jgi:flagellar hook-length control protein FliK
MVAQTGNGAPQAALAGPKDAPAKDGDETPDSKFDVKADAAARNAPPADVAHRGPDKPAPDMTLAPPKPGTDAPQPLTVTTPAPQTAAASPASVAAAPTAQPAAQPAAVPLAGVAIEIAGKALAGKNHFSIRLDPPELGRIEVHLDVHRDGRVTSHLVADRKDTLDLFRRDAAGLERALQDAGLKTSDNGLQFSLRDQQNAWQQQQQQQQPKNANSVRLVADDRLPAIDATQTGVRLSYRSGGLDIRV